MAMQSANADQQIPCEIHHQESHRSLARIGGFYRQAGMHHLKRRQLLLTELKAILRYVTQVRKSTLSLGDCSILKQSNHQLVD